MSRSATDRDSFRFPRTSTLIADPDNIGRALAIAYFIIVVVDQTIGFGARWDVGFGVATIAGIVIGAAITLLLLTGAKFLYLGTKVARRHVSVMLVTMFVSGLIGTTIGRVVTAAVSAPGSRGSDAVGLDLMIFETVVLAMIAWSIGTLRTYRSAVNDLQAAQQELAAAKKVSEGALRAEREDLIEPVAVALVDLSDALPALTAADAAARIRATSDELIRPVSHELIAATAPVELPPAEPLPRPSWSQTLANVAASPLLLPKVMAITMMLLVGRLSVFDTAAAPATEGEPLTLTVDWVSLIRALSQLAIVFLVVWFTTTVALRLLRPLLPTRQPLVRWGIVLASVPVVAVLSQVIILVIFSLPSVSPQTQPTLRNPLVFIVPLIIIATVAGILRTARTRFIDVLRELQARNAELAYALARLNEELWMQRRGLSKTLHGAIQGTLNSAALLLSQATSDTEIATARQEAVQRIHRATIELQSATPDHVDVDQELAQIKQTWNGICEIDITTSQDILDRIQGDPVCATSFVDIVGEATANAVIHGGAQNIAFTITEQSPRELRIEAHDDGSGVQVRNGGGLGSQLLREACTEWGLTSNEDLTRLFAVVPMQGPPASDGS